MWKIAAVAVSIRVIQLYEFVETGFLIWRCFVQLEDLVRGRIGRERRHFRP